MSTAATTPARYSIAQATLAELEEEARVTLSVLRRIPENKLSWKPHPRSMSVGQLALHIAVLPGAFTQVVQTSGMEAPKFEHPEATSVQQCVDTMEEGLASARALLPGLDDDYLSATWSVTDNGRTIFSLPKAKLLRVLMLNHQYHHRGQLSVYLRLLDVPVPSIYGPSADENPFA